MDLDATLSVSDVLYRRGENGTSKLCNLHDEKLVNRFLRDLYALVKIIQLSTLTII